MNEILKIANLITDKLQLKLTEEDSKKLIDIIKQKNIDKDIKINDKLQEKINELLDADEDINNFDIYIKSQDVKDNFNLLKKNLAELQIRVLLKNLEKAESCDDVINILLKTLNNNISINNKILSDNLNNKTTPNLTPKLTSNKNNYKNKYLKYKNKYLKLKNYII